MIKILLSTLNTSYAKTSTRRAIGGVTNSACERAEGEGEKRKEKTNYPQEPSAGVEKDVRAQASERGRCFLVD